MTLRDDARVESFAPFVISETDYNAKRQNQARKFFDNNKKSDEQDAHLSNKKKFKDKF